MRILIADDERAIVDGIVAIIEGINWYAIDTITAFDGLDALEKMKLHKPDIAILDIHMPRMTGLELAEQAYRWNLCSNCFILTGFNEFEYAQKAIRSHVKDYMLKPVNKKYLIEAVEQIAKKSGEEEIHPDEECYEDIEFLRFTLQNTGQSIVINDIIDYIDSRYKEDISLTYIAEMMNKHPNYISNLFSKETNTSFIKYLQYVRLKQAMHRLINEPNTSIKYIAHKVGYQNPREFFKVFKKKINYTPTQFRGKYGHKKE
ncbi:response regulator transcription factor [Vallitalea okinawensis]|uniref:response regulator transcription factor n=1 Tax=Vallitalea okinawensis TaxID=2078660 RepID=UPI000CFBD1EE|nr:response regulator [Vallitalea okinawensis]